MGKDDYSQVQVMKGCQVGCQVHCGWRYSLLCC